MTNENENEKNLKQINLQAEEGFETEEENDKSSFEIAVNTLMDKHNISLKSDIERPSQLVGLALIRDYFKDQKHEKLKTFFDEYINNYLEFRVSNERKGRRELVELAKALDEKDEEEQGKSIADKLTQQI